MLMEVALIKAIGNKPDYYTQIRIVFCAVM